MSRLHAAWLGSFGTLSFSVLAGIDGLLYVATINAGYTLLNIWNFEKAILRELELD